RRPTAPNGSASNAPRRRRCSSRRASRSRKRIQITRAGRSRTPRRSSTSALTFFYSKENDQGYGKENVLELLQLPHPILEAPLRRRDRRPRASDYGLLHEG